MMNSATKPNPASNMIRAIQQKVLERLHRGEARVESDLTILHKHLQLAQEMTDWLLVGELHEVMGSIYNDIGHFESAGTHYAAAYRNFEKIPYPAGMAVIQNNLGDLYYHLNQLEAAREAYEEARTHAETANFKQGIMMIESNLGWLWLEMGDYLQAQVCFALVVAMTETETWQHVYSLCTAHRGLAELALFAKDYDLAWREANEAQFLADGRHLQLSLAKTFITKGHIAETDPATPERPNYFYQRAREALQAYGNPIVLARIYMVEARYHKAKENAGEAARLAEIARARFLDLNLADEVALVDEFIRTL